MREWRMHAVVSLLALGWENAPLRLSEIIYHCLFCCVASARVGCLGYDGRLVQIALGWWIV